MPKPQQNSLSSCLVLAILSGTLVFSFSQNIAFAASHLQHWAILLSSYCYNIKYKSSGDIANADALYRLPLKFQHNASVESLIFHVATQQVMQHPVKASRLQIAQETAPAIEYCHSHQMLVQAALAPSPSLHVAFE